MDGSNSISGVVTPKGATAISDRTFKLLVVAGVIAIFLIVGVTVAILMTKNKIDQKNINSENQELQGQNNEQNSGQAMDQNDPMAMWKKGCVGDSKVMMRNLPMNIGDVGSILPLGMVAGGHVTPIDHLYFSPIIFNSPRDKYPVFAMADGYIIEVSVRKQVVGSGQEQKPEYRIVMQHSCETISYFDLVTSLDQEILDQIPQLSTSDYVGDIRVKVVGGQEIGRIGGQTLDTAIYNMNLELEGFISPELYIAEPWKIHTDDFFSYFPEGLVAQMNSKNFRQAEPRGGMIDWDQPGKLIGNWFREGTNGYAGSQGQTGVQAYWEGHLHVGYDAIKPDNVWISIGNFSGEATHFYVKGNSPDPANVSVDSGLVKYELIQPANFRTMTEVNSYRRTEGPVKGVILLQVMPDEKLKVEVVPGKTGSQVNGFSEAALIYER